MDCLTEEELKLAQAPYIPPKFAYIYYNSNREIIMISPIKYDNLDYLEVEFNRAKDFLDGKKDSARYDLEYFKSGIRVEKKKDQDIRKNLYYQIPTIKQVNECDITLIHNNEYWEIIANSDVIDVLERRNLNSSLKFYVTHKAKPHLLLSTIELKGIDILSKKIVPFKNKEEADFDNISVYVYPEFDSYGLMK